MTEKTFCMGSELPMMLVKAVLPLAQLLAQDLVLHLELSALEDAPDRSA